MKPKSFPYSVNIEKLNLDKSKKFIVVDALGRAPGGSGSHTSFYDGDVLELSDSPSFSSVGYFKRLSDGLIADCSYGRLAYYEPELSWDKIDKSYLDKIVISPSGYERLILDYTVHGKIISLYGASGVNFKDVASLKKEGWKFKDNKEEEEIKEMTVEEVSQLAGKRVKIVESQK